MSGHNAETVMAEILGPQKLGPLTPLVGEWEGDAGVDLSYHNKDDETSETGYFEKAWFRPIPIVENGQQTNTLTAATRHPGPARKLDHFTRVDADFLQWFEENTGE